MGSEDHYYLTVIVKKEGTGVGLQFHPSIAIHTDILQLLTFFSFDGLLICPQHRPSWVELLEASWNPLAYRMVIEDSIALWEDELRVIIP